MKKLMCTASLALSFLIAIPVNQVMAIPSNADVCQQAMRPATTGGGTREQLEAAIKCRKQSSVKSQVTTQQPVTSPREMKMDSSTMPGMKMDGNMMPNTMQDKTRNR